MARPEHIAVQEIAEAMERGLRSEVRHLSALYPEQAATAKRVCRRHRQEKQSKQLTLNYSKPLPSDEAEQCPLRFR